MASVSRLAWALLALALLGATASLFGPEGRHGGVDIGATGAALFGCTLWTGAGLLGKDPDRIFSPAWSIAERRARHFIWNLSVLLIAWAVVSKKIGGSPANAVDFDERDQRTQRAADRASDLAFTLAVIGCVALLVPLPAERLQWWLVPLIAAHVLIGMLIVRSLSEYSYLVVSYARERG